MGRLHLGVRLSRGQLASAGVALAHDGRAAFRRARLGPSPDQRAAAHGHDAAAVRGAKTDDRFCLAQRGGGGAVRLASAPCGIRGVGGGTEGRVVRIFLDADAAGLRAFCGTVQSPSAFAKLRRDKKPKVQSFLCGHAAGVRAGADGEADGGDAAVRAAAAGLLAAGKNSK